MRATDLRTATDLIRQGIQKLARYANAPQKYPRDRELRVGHRGRPSRCRARRPGLRIVHRPEPGAAGQAVASALLPVDDAGQPSGETRLGGAGSGAVSGSFRTPRKITNR